MVIQLAEGVQGLFPETPDNFVKVSDGWSNCYYKHSDLGGTVKTAGASIPKECIITGLQYYFKIAGGTAAAWDFWIEIQQSHGTYKVAEMTESTLTFSSGIQNVVFAIPIKAKAGDIIWWCWKTPAGTIHLEDGWCVSIQTQAE